MNSKNPETDDSDSDDQDYRPEDNDTDSDAANGAVSDISANEDDYGEIPTNSHGKRKQSITKTTRGRTSKRTRHDPDDASSTAVTIKEPDPARRSKLDAFWAEMNTSTKPTSSSSSLTGPKKNETTSATKSVDDIWKEMNTPTGSVPSPEVGAPSSTATKKTVKVTENYVFAGQTISVTKEVSADTADASLASTTTASPSGGKYNPKSPISLLATPTPPSKLRPTATTARSLTPASQSGLIRPKSTLTALASQLGNKAKKLNTLEKSKMDWNKFVGDEGIEDELKHHNKDGYMEKVAFLQRVDERRLAELKDGQRAAAKKS